MGEKKVACPRCGGSPEFDEEGKVYSCYFCFDLGEVPESWAAEEARERAWYAFLAAEKRILLRVECGVPAEAVRWWIDEEEGPMWVLPGSAAVYRKSWRDFDYEAEFRDDGSIVEADSGALIVPALAGDEFDDDIPF